MIAEETALRHIDYPNELDDIVVVGYRSATARAFTLRPLHPGTYVLVIWPRHFPYRRWVRRHVVAFEDAAGPPEHVLFDTGAEKLPALPEWEWRLMRTEELGPHARMADEIFSGAPVAFGVLRFELERVPSEVRTVAWSCHQPYVSENGRGVLGPHTTDILSWYRRLVGEFDPGVIWGEGDCAYSDGTEATNFSDQVYDHPGWKDSPGARTWVTDAYRRMFRYHWSLPGMRETMHEYPHILTWDDHEIHDGWGSEANDFTDDNVAMFTLARAVADEYLFQSGPRLRPGGDAHQAYVVGPQASFIFDSRTSRRYSNPGGRIVSDEQLEDLARFCNDIAQSPSVRFLVLGTTVPFLYIKDFWEGLGARAPKAVTDLTGGVRDDLRDSWSSPGNRGALERVLSIVKDLLQRRPSLHVVNVSGDIHVSNAFRIWPLGFPRPIYQVTTSAITNREHLSDLGSEIMSLDTVQFMPVLGFVQKLWSEITDPNVLCITTSETSMTLRLRVLPVDDSVATDQELVLD